MVLQVNGTLSFQAATGKYVGSSSVHPIYQQMFELVVNREYAYTDESTPLAVVRKPADKPAVAP